MYEKKFIIHNKNIGEKKKTHTKVISLYSTLELKFYFKCNYLFGSFA